MIGLVHILCVSSSDCLFTSNWIVDSNCSLCTLVMVANSLSTYLHLYFEDYLFAKKWEQGTHYTKLKMDFFALFSFFNTEVMMISLLQICVA